ncbi:MAG: Holliday junction branch migration DNA helicase RuvB [Bdellovibrio sp. CG12_big_fil_rev_8_21_14_0_65_39_13]|nr:MAG: Holliday junction branch migration DNA helicase RuvB [Bdellovibrio sp. CG22_combo_CG10-13_8_21_14_all_39_27]PIQ60645.1 MAG: Holliday junction branch migration DNA helicase RuvB [Bdellovibrio sp. CG12_big_fil_rev_8_21_14_0_65_39_13]PIR37029.1 MAG: Holliday junction branch migration DNA helicase RuvB [Bdellovibrio sp. CG11_big_fil_rev_8_21_14_0_20_39_38]PJB52446.1 MAG: Holliday junction branch migration DNA helicase RuvB [Bdellovibrio sp. CG_4_9_14_3_um_filter_39_7]
MEENRFLDPIERNEVTYESRLRPDNFSEYVGQKKIISNIEVMVESARIRQQPIDHFLLSGPPGLGKTSLAYLVAKELGVNLHVVSGPAVEKKGDLAAVLTNLQPRDVLFIDEIHRLHISIEEILYSAMEDFRLDILIGQGPSARTMQIEIPPFTLIGATTRSGLISNPLRDRFVAHLHFDFYSSEELALIIKENSKKLGLTVDEKALHHMSKCSRGTPRIANRILRRVRDFAVINKSTVINDQDVLNSLKLMDIDEAGLDRMDRKILSVIKDYYGGGPVGIDALSATLAEDRSTLEDVYEPFLLKEGFIIRTPRGREITQKATEHLI